ncbi:hypothetical protein BPAE_0481g00020 [Botrytis paeoniae]|uniref:Cytochrome P450 n=1 Tax=Botrytis paeoniae TaxID=278948 RepID=A0A4Z1F0P6_9HELO|nr:hypothetical protein BPAE_0481g00020 [Botrytis paeoniae]
MGQHLKQYYAVLPVFYSINATDMTGAILPDLVRKRTNRYLRCQYLVFEWHLIFVDFDKLPNADSSFKALKIDDSIFYQTVFTLEIPSHVSETLNSSPANMLLLLSTEQTLSVVLLGTFAVALSTSYATKQKYGSLRPLQYAMAWIKECINEWGYLYNAPRMIQEGYEEANGAPFVVRSPGLSHTFVSSQKFIKEIDMAPDSVLSLQAAAKQVLQPQYSMAEFNWFEQRGIDTTPLGRTLRSLLTNNIPNLLPVTRTGTGTILDDMFDAEQKPHLSEIMRQAVASTNAIALFGQEQAKNKEFMHAAIDFIEKTIIIAEVVRLLPPFLAPYLGRFVAGRFGSHKIIYNTLVPIAQQRLDEQAQAKLGHKVPEHKDCIQWVMEQTFKTSKPWSAERIIHEIMALWFGSVHAMKMSLEFAIHELCLHPEYAEPLRKEFEGPEYKIFETTGNGLPLMDSFLKESARLSPVDNLSTRRKALEPFTLSDGTIIAKDHWICTPLKPMMRDARNYARPLEFHGFRHVDAATLLAVSNTGSFQSPEPEKASPITDINDWQIWGTGRMACPGRFYAVAAMKQIFGLIITKYDCTLSDVNAPRFTTWRNCNVPSPEAPVVLHAREDIPVTD